MTHSLGGTVALFFTGATGLPHTSDGMSSEQHTPFQFCWERATRDKAKSVMRESTFTSHPEYGTIGGEENI